MTSNVFCVSSTECGFKTKICFFLLATTTQCYDCTTTSKSQRYIESIYQRSFETFHFAIACGNPFAKIVHYSILPLDNKYLIPQ